MVVVRDDSVGVPVKVGRANDYELENHDIDAFERYCTESRLFQFPKDEAWWALKQVFPFRTIGTLHGVVNLTRYERQYFYRI